MITESLILNLLTILAAAWLLGYLFSRLGMPLMLGQLLAGVILGPPLLGWVTATPSLELMADMGIFFVMFSSGMEMNPKEVIEHIKPAAATSLGGFILPYILGFIVTRLFGGTTFQSLFVGLGISITAIAVQSVVLRSMRINQTEIGHVIIGAAIINDILAFIGLSVLFGLVRTGGIVWSDMVLLLLKVALFFSLVVVVSELIMPRLAKHVTDVEGFGFTFGISMALAMGYLAELAGLHIVIGAFVAGQFVRREIMDEKVYEVIEDRFFGIAYGFLVPIFFVSLSFHLHFVWNWWFISFSLVLTAVAIIGKLFGAGLAFWPFRRNLREAMVVGFGMNGRGAVELVIASVVIAFSAELMKAGTITAPLLTDEQFSALIITAFITTLLAPITLKFAVQRSCQPDEYTNFCRILSETPPR
jgi:Kef-type K+ transport system membrane component KefB